MTWKRSKTILSRAPGTCSSVTWMYGPHMSIATASMPANCTADSPGQELAAVQVPPRALLDVVVDGEFEAARRARPARTVAVLRPDVHPLRLDRELDTRHRPRRLQPQEVTVQLDVAHGPSSLLGPFLQRF